MSRLSVLGCTLIFTVRLATAQTSGEASPQPSPLLSPQAAYDKASLPVDITRRSFGNWSEVEQASLQVGQSQAKDACVARAEVKYTGDDLVAYARLCAFGKAWRQTYLAATTYINGPDPGKPLLADAYSFEIQAELNLNNEKAAVGACFAMLRSVPYGPIVDDVTTGTFRYLHFAYLPDALDLLFQRQPFLLAYLHSSAQPGAAISPHLLFEHALDLAALQQYNAQPDRAAAAVAEIDKAMPATLPPDEVIQIAAVRRQYALLGTHLPQWPDAVSLISANANAPGQIRLGEATVLLLFPPWCVQCIRQAQDIVPTLFRVAMVNGSDSQLHIYALLADQPPAAVAPPRKASKALRPTPPESAQVAVTTGPARLPNAVEELRKTPTLVVPPATLTDFNASDFPFLIAADSDGIIRLLVPGAPDNALKQNGPIDQIADTIRQHWPAKAHETSGAPRVSAQPRP